MRQWQRTIKIKQFLNPGGPLAETRDRIAAALRCDPEYGADNDFSIIVDDLAEAPTVEDFDEALDSLYDWADANSVWIGGQP